MSGETPKNPSSPPPEVARDVFVVIAAYNEGPCLAEVIQAVRAIYPHVVVVDDGSSDETHEIAKQHTGFALRHAINRGQGAALQTGIEFSLRRGARFVVTFDGDGQHRVEDIWALVEPIHRGECEIVLGSRFLGETIDMPRSRRITLQLAVLFTRAVNRVNLTDAHNGLRAFSRKAAKKIDITLDRMAHASELIDQVAHSGLTFKEIPVQIRYTEHSLAKGQSSRGALRIVFHYLVGRVMR